MFLKKILSYPYRCKDVLPLFGRNSTSFDIYTQSYLSTLPSQTRVIEFNFLQTPYLQKYADAVTGKGALFYNCYNFIGGTIARIFLPVLNERVVYSHDTRAHGGKAEDMTVCYALWIRSIRLSQISGCHGLIINLCFSMVTMLNQPVYISRSLTAKEN